MAFNQPIFDLEVLHATGQRRLTPAWRACFKEILMAAEAAKFRPPQWATRLRPPDPIPDPELPVEWILLGDLLQHQLMASRQSDLEWPLGAAIQNDGLLKEVLEETAAHLSAELDAVKAKLQNL